MKGRKQNRRRKSGRGTGIAEGSTASFPFQTNLLQVPIALSQGLTSKTFTYADLLKDISITNSRSVRLVHVKLLVAPTTLILGTAPALTSLPYSASVQLLWSEYTTTNITPVTGIRQTSAVSPTTLQARIPSKIFAPTNVASTVLTVIIDSALSTNTNATLYVNLVCIWHMARDNTLLFPLYLTSIQEEDSYDLESVVGAVRHMVAPKQFEHVPNVQVSRRR